MATKTIIQTLCDFCGEEAVRSSVFLFRQTSKSQAGEREIDLCKQHADAFDGIIAPYIAVSRKRSVPKQTSIDTNGDVTKAIRVWARENGFDVGDRGRLAPEVLSAWEAAQSS